MGSLFYFLSLTPVCFLLMFYPQDAMLAQVLAIALCLCLSVTSQCFVEMAERIELVLAWELPSTSPALC